MSETTTRDGMGRAWTKIAGRWRMTVHVHDPVRDPEPVTVGTTTQLEEQLLDALAATRAALEEKTREAEQMREDAERWRTVSPYVERLRETLVAHVWPEDGVAYNRRLRDALIGQVSDATFYSRWERSKADLRELLDAIDAALAGQEGAHD